jgi:mono/diheme cytochrome c family protein
VRFAAGVLLILALAACSRREPPPAAKPAVATPPPVSATTVKPAAPAAQPPATAVPAKGDAAPAALAGKAPVKDGATIYNELCASCHMADGGGVPYMQPPIRGSAWISNPDPQYLLSLILRGAAVVGEAANAWDNRMPPLDHLSDAEIAAVATYVRTHFATPPVDKPVTPAEVAVARARPGLPQ